MKKIYITTGLAGLLHLLLITGIYAQSVVINVNTTAEKKAISPYIFGKNNSLSDNFLGSGDLSASQWQRLKDMGIKMFRENGGNNSTKYNWRRKLSSHPDWYNNVYAHDWGYAARSLQQNIPSAQGMWAFQLIGKAAKTSAHNFNDWGYNGSKWWEGCGQNLAGGGVVNPAGGTDALVEGNPDLYLETWNADSTTGILDHWFGPDGIGLDSNKILYWSMDNEPEIWNGTHDDVWPVQPSAEEFMQMYFATAKKARAKFPGIKLTGPVVANEWQWYCWAGDLISYKGKKYPWLEYFILRVAEEQQLSDIRLLDVLDIHFYPNETDPAQIVQLHRIFFDSTYVYPGANGIKKTGSSGWDNSLNKEYIFKRCNAWLAKYMGAGHGVKLAVTETAIKKRDDPDLTANWYASTLGEFARNGVEIFTPWDWVTGMSEVVHLFTHYCKPNILPAISSNENYVSAYPTINNSGDSITVFFVNRHLKDSKPVTLYLENFYVDDGPYNFYTLSDLPASETFVSHTQNALNLSTVVVKDNIIQLILDPLSVSALVLKRGKFDIAPSLIDTFATQATKDLYEFLKSQFGNHIISGQTHDYYNQLKTVAGKSPMLRAGDFQHYTQGYPYLWSNEIGGHTYGYDTQANTVSTLISWYNGTDKKGIVSMQWHWHDPLSDSTSNVSTNTFYTDQTSFDIRRAVIPGTFEYDCVIRDIDSIATQLKKFQSAGIPVLWRPLHEAGGGWFWWGAHGPEPCLALWDILIERLKNHHQLHNLIWVWSSPEPDWYPGNDKVDIIGYDSYPGAFNYTNQKAIFDNLYTITDGEKLIAMTENGPIPDPVACIEGDSPWLFFMSWNNLVETQNTTDHIRSVYNNPLVVKLESFDPPEYSVTIKLLRDLTFEPLQSNAVVFNGVTEVTDFEGEVTYTVTPGSYDYLVQLTSYESKEGTFEITSDTSFTILLQQTHANIRIRLREESRPVANAVVALNGDTMLTSSLGDAVYNQRPVSQIYSYTVNKEGYEELSGTVQLARDTIVQLEMTRIVLSAGYGSGDIKFTIWPNPADEYVHFGLPDGNQPVQVQITGVNGGFTKNTSVQNPPWRISVNDLAPGIYVLQVICKESVYKGLFSKQ